MKTESTNADDLVALARKVPHEKQGVAAAVLKYLGGESSENIKTVLLAIQRLAAYETLRQKSDLRNPILTEDESYSRADLLVNYYARLRNVLPTYQDDSEELTTARSIRNKVNHRRRKARQKAEAANMGMT